MKKKLLAVILALAMVIALAGCGATAASNSAAPASVSTEDSAPQVVEEPEDAEVPETPDAPEVSASEAEPVEPAVTVEYPLCESGEISLDVFMAMSGFLPMVIPDVANTGLDTNRGVMLMEEATGVNLNWTLID